MGKEYFNPYAFNALEWVSVAVTLAMITLRLYIRVYRRGSIFALKTWNPADVVMIFAWFGFLSQILVDTILLHKYRYPIITQMYTDQEIIEVGKAQYYSQAAYWIVLYAVRVSILFFLGEFIPRVIYKTWIAVRVLGGFTLLAGTVTVLYSFFWCLPIPDRWSVFGECFMVDPSRYDRLTMFQNTLSIIVDLLIFILPFFLLKQMINLPLSQKIGAALMFALGAFSIVFCAINFWIVRMSFDDPWWQFASMWFGWSEQTSLMLIQCIPALKAFYRINQLKRERNDNLEKNHDGGESGRPSKLTGSDGTTVTSSLHKSDYECSAVEGDSRPNTGRN